MQKIFWGLVVALLAAAGIFTATAAENEVSDVKPAAELDAAVASLASSICAKPVEAVRAGKGLFYRQLEMGVEAAYQLAGQTMACNMMEESALEGVQAFIDKRAPDWRR